MVTELLKNFPELQQSLLQKKKVLKQFEIYKNLLQQFNKNFNLYSRSGSFSLNDLFADSLFGALVLEKVFKTSSSPVLDMGSGNGFPGLVCAILYPETFFILCDRSLKKTEFLNHCVFKLNCSNVKVLCQEATDLKDKFKIALSKGTASTETVLKILQKVLSPEGKAFLWKNSHWKRDWPKESSFSPKVLKTYKIKEQTKVLLKVRHL